MKRVLICGDRYWDNIDAIRREMIKLPKDTYIIQGCAKGADKIAAKVATELGLPLISSKDNNNTLNNPGFPADWTRYGKGAGPIRNKQMRDEGKPDEVWAFHGNLDKSRGTKNMVNLALEKHVPVKVFKS